MRRREVDAAVVGEQKLLHVEVGDAKHEHVVEPLAVLVDGIRPPAPVEAEHLPVHEVGGPTVLGDVFRRSRKGERELG